MMIRLASVLCPVLAASCALLVAFGGTGGDYARSRTMPAPMIEPAPPALVPARVEAPSALPAIAHDPGALVARSLNAITPFATRPLVAAPSFVMGGGFADRERAVDCLAAAAYYEAGTGAEDQRAVAQVILNRMRHPAFPHTVCGVVFQGSERSTGCQFTFTCDGSIARRQPSALNWRKAQLVAEDMLSGRVEAEVGLATHYHTDWVMPSWNREMDKIAAIKTHLFFQWRGA
ncbi:MAG: cell wall hydrolase, partial [Rhizorhabdus sp.]